MDNKEEKWEIITKTKNRIYYHLDILSKYNIAGAREWVDETKSGLRDMLLLYFNIHRSKSIDEDLIEELSDIIDAYLNLFEKTINTIPEVAEKSKNDTKPNILDENIIKILRNSLDIPSVILGRKKIIEVMQNWILGSRTIFEAPIYGISHRGSSLKIGKVYSIILNLIENAFNPFQPTCFFCLPVIAGKTKSNVYFPMVRDKEIELISVEINLGAFFNLAIGIVLVAHEAGHYLSPINHEKLNYSFLEIIFDDLAYILALNLINLPFGPTATDDIIELVKYSKSIIYDWLKDDLILYANQIGGEEFFLKPLKEFELLLESYFTTFSDSSPRKRDIDSLSNTIMEAIPKKVNEFIEELNIHRIDLKKKNQLINDLFII